MSPFCPILIAERKPAGGGVVRRGRGPICGATLALLLCGCGGKSYNVSNPVLGPPPPRIARADVTERGQEDQSIQPVKYEQRVPLPMTAVVATVNGKPILAGEVLEQYLAKLQAYDAQLAQAVAKGQISEDARQGEVRRAQEMLLKRDLPQLIEQTLMADAVRGKLKKDQLESINKQLDGFFDREVENLKKKFKVDSAAEVEALLQQQGMSLETMRKIFGDRQLAQQYVRTKMGDDPKPTRAELLSIYNSQLEKYAQPTQVKWQQLQVTIANDRSRSEALAVVDKALEELAAGATFDAVVKKYSDGPLKDNGGHWDWTQPASVANADVRNALETLRAGEISPVLSSPTQLQLVKVNQRREAGHQPFEEVQEEIRLQIIDEYREQKVKEILADMKAKAIIETLFDEDFQPGEISAGEGKNSVRPATLAGKNPEK